MLFTGLGPVISVFMPSKLIIKSLFSKLRSRLCYTFNKLSYCNMFLEDMWSQSYLFVLAYPVSLDYVE